jgi:fatty acid desaturase
LILHSRAFSVPTQNIWRHDVDRHATPEDDINLCHLLIAVGIHTTLTNSSGLLWHWRWWWWHFLLIQKSFALFQIMTWGAVNLTPFLYITETPKMHLLLLI